MRSEEVSEALRNLLPSDVLSEANRIEDRASELLPQETKQARNYGPKRLDEFSSGRVLARSLVEKLGISCGPILSGKNRQPIWPSRVVGSLSHSSGFVAAGVGLGSDYVSIGIDIEFRESLDSRLHPKILRPEERSLLQGEKLMDSGRLALLWFSAKEAFYKAQFPISEEFLGFEALSLERPDEDQVIPFAIQDEKLSETLSRYRVVMMGSSLDHFVISACVIRRADPPKVEAPPEASI